MDTEKLTPSTEDYLEAIYVLDNEGTGVRSVDVANFLEVAKPSVNRALKNLADSGFITQQRYSLIYLTKEGASKAKEVLNRHETIQYFLGKILGVDEGVAAKEACLIEHVMSNDTVEKMQSFIKNYHNK